jgi:hypothetical protein
MRRAALAFLLLPLAACGLRAPLEPAPGQHMPPAPAMAPRPLTTDELMAPPPIARPDRIDESLRRSEERGGDRFALPPGDAKADANQSGDAPQ